MREVHTKQQQSLQSTPVDNEIDIIELVAGFHDLQGAEHGPPGTVFETSNVGVSVGGVESLGGHEPGKVAKQDPRGISWDAEGMSGMLSAAGASSGGLRGLERTPSIAAQELVVGAGTGDWLVAWLQSLVMNRAQLLCQLRHHPRMLDLKTQCTCLLGQGSKYSSLAGRAGHHPWGATEHIEA